MSGFGGRDEKRGAETIHDDLFCRVVYAEHGGEKALIAGFDLLFFAREHADRMKAAVGRALDLTPRQILLNTSHTHAGPCVDRWGYSSSHLPDLGYLALVESALVRAAIEAKRRACEVTVWAGQGTTRLPVSRRKPDGKGGVEWRPYPQGKVCNTVPFCAFRDKTGNTVAFLYSVSCHPSTIGGWTMSADYPGVACNRLDTHFGQPCSVFLQGAGGDTKACTIADGRDEVDVAWRSGTPADVEKAGVIVAEDVIKAVEKGPVECKPLLKSALAEMEWPLEKLPGRDVLAENARSEDPVRRLMAQSRLADLDRWGNLPDKAGLLIQGIQLAEGLRIVAVEGELVAELGLEVMAAFRSGTTFALGYSNGTGLYLPNSRMLKEGGYEAESSHEYGFAAKLKSGVEELLARGVADLKRAAIG